MKLDIKPGKYVVAVSGGVDSMVLLDLLRQQPGLELVVAHFDHGIRPDSAEDRKLVQKIAGQYSLPFVYKEGKLGADVSEAEARTKRYDFLRSEQKRTAADAILTAHHRDDMLETAIINMLRGTGRKGLSSLSSSDDMLRPLLEWTKEDILSCARQNDLSWHEDTTNQNDKYLRNYIRQHIMPRFDKTRRQELLEHIQSSRKINSQIDELLARDISANSASLNKLNRSWFIALPHAVSREAMAAWLRQNRISDFDRPLIEKLVVTAKTKPPGKAADVNAKYAIKIEKDEITLFERRYRQ